LLLTILSCAGKTPAAQKAPMDLGASTALMNQYPDEFQLLATYRGIGANFAFTVGPGPTEDSERLYASYIYLENTFEIAAIDPETDEVKLFPNTIKGEYGAHCMVAGPDGNVYLGTLPGAHLVKLHTKAGKLIDLGRPSSTEEYIWDVAFGPDGKLYGATYPNAKLVRYDPTSRVLDDLGRMDPVENYAHFLAGSDDGFMYVGIGMAKMNIAAYQITTGECREILPPQFQVPGNAMVYRGTDGNVYAVAGERYFRLDHWVAMPIALKDAAPPIPKNKLHDGRLLDLQGHTLVIKDPIHAQSIEHRIDYEGNELPVFRIGFGPDGFLYGSSILPARLLRMDMTRPQFQELAELGGGEVYSFLTHGDKLLMAAYSTPAPLMVYDPGKPFRKDPPDPNPLLVNFKDSDKNWRPLAFINGPDGKVFIGSISGYGKLGGPLCMWNVQTGTIDLYPNLIRDQSVTTLAVWRNLIMGGSTISGGGGSHPTQKDAEIFLWNPETRKLEFEAIPVPGASSIYNLLAAPNGLVYGIADRTMFIFDPDARTVTHRQALPFPGRTIENAMALGPDGRIWGLAEHPEAGIFTIDTTTNKVTLIAHTPRAITGGFAITGNYLYFVCGASLYRYTLPEKY
jgi:streptogramin lyase